MNSSPCDFPTAELTWLNDEKGTLTPLRVSSRSLDRFAETMTGTLDRLELQFADFMTRNSKHGTARR